ncbi:DUF3828 domain-containing protein [Caenorhabditis elegans]|uniref:DUF3828 domain-containing protein n=1 Tax=Caenorhabditis elegans TaxID=6239 RepID=Q9N5F1_CAEEL|nr:DUF3828 domain-containing protein [Caenorhabditis elegans]CCD73581.1 DUF3828 domain-containing protein [Caenorhabditis elegans]|eukprot:NP_493788.1 Uncharacterized protein CELE_T02H6.10 [Caenorhabditis elegans]
MFRSTTLLIFTLVATLHAQSGSPKLNCKAYWLTRYILDNNANKTNTDTYRVECGYELHKPLSDGEIQYLPEKVAASVITSGLPERVDKGQLVGLVQDAMVPHEQKVEIIEKPHSTT